MRQDLVSKYFLGELTLEDILPCGLDGINIKIYDLPVSSARKRMGRLLIWMEEINDPNEPEFSIPLSSKIKRIEGNRAELYVETRTMGGLENQLMTLIFKRVVI